MTLLARLLRFSPLVLFSLYLALFCNTVLWRELFAVKGGFTINNALFYAPFFVVLVLLLVVFFALFRFKYLFKTVLIFFAMAAAATDYFMQDYGVFIDKGMLQNVLETNSHEINELITWPFIWHLLIFGAIPAFLLSRITLNYQSAPKQMLRNLGSALFSISLMAVTFYFFYGDYTSIYRNNRQIRYLINPVNIVDASFVTFKHYLKPKHALVSVGSDAKLATNLNAPHKKKLTILVLGETARAANFSLDGYSRKTNPNLSQEPVISFTNVHSCGTATAASVPCMFSFFGRENYDSQKAGYTENVLDVLSHAGIKILWRNNNDSCKHVCNRVVSEDLSHLKLSDLCNPNECYDEVLLHHLQAYVDKLTGNGFVVLHQKGSHGPDYHLRHPPGFKVFAPECDRANLNDCSHQEVVNAYDNTIAYTDFFLDKVIEFLKKNSSEYDTAMLYVSDHGESLGENNVYLHGLPYFIAPDEQTHVPLITWFSKDFIAHNNISTDCLRDHRDIQYSHDNLVHSLIGLMNVKTEVYNAKLDIFSTCRV